MQLLLTAGVETHLVVSPLGQRLLRDELGMEGLDLAALAGRTFASNFAGSTVPEPPPPRWACLRRA